MRARTVDLTAVGAAGEFVVIFAGQREQLVDDFTFIHLNELAVAARAALEGGDERFEAKKMDALGQLVDRVIGAHTAAKADDFPFEQPPITGEDDAALIVGTFCNGFVGPILRIDNIEAEQPQVIGQFTQVVVKDELWRGIVEGKTAWYMRENVDVVTVLNRVGQVDRPITANNGADFGMGDAKRFDDMLDCDLVGEFDFYRGRTVILRQKIDQISVKRQLDFSHTRKPSCHEWARSAGIISAAATRPGKPLRNYTLRVTTKNLNKFTQSGKLCSFILFATRNLRTTKCGARPAAVTGAQKIQIGRASCRE